jgi:hypothetical protein
MQNFKWSSFCLEPHPSFFVAVCKLRKNIYLAFMLRTQITPITSIPRMSSVKYDTIYSLQCALEQVAAPFMLWTVMIGDSLAAALSTTGLQELYFYQATTRTLFWIPSRIKVAKIPVKTCLALKFSHELHPALAPNTVSGNLHTEKHDLE